MSAISLVDLNVAYPQQQPLQLAVQICLGILGRPENVAKSGHRFYSYRSVEEDNNLEWLNDTEPDVTATDISVPAFLDECYASGALKGYIKYNYTEQKAVIPNLVSMAAVMDSVILEDGDDGIGLDLVFDATAEWKSFDAFDATTYMFENYIQNTTGLCKSNPGLDVHGNHPLNPPLTGDMNVGLMDFVVKNRLFNFFLNLGCAPGTAEHKLMEKIANYEGFKKPVTVWGYDDTFGAWAGDKFEAETDCVSEHNLGQVASNGFTNLAFFSQSDPIEDELLQNPGIDSLSFEKNKSYVSFIIGDGDNLNIVKGQHKDWWEDRKEFCISGKNWPQYNITAENACFPLVWTISPQLLDVAPAMIQWYYDQAALTTADYFILPPSGHLYSYPGAMSAVDQNSYKALTERDAQKMNISGTVHWEWFSKWKSALSYFEKFSADENPIVNGFHLVNVPFVFPIEEIFGTHDKKVLDDKVVLFKSREWRGCREKTHDKTLYSPDELAEEINGYSPGTVKSLYLTQDGGLNMTHVYELVGKLDLSKTVIVNQEDLVKMALEAEKANEGA